MDDSERGRTSDGARQPLTLPDWLPPAVAKQVRLIEARCLPADQQAILQRLVTDARNAQCMDRGEDSFAKSLSAARVETKRSRPPL
jgi:hypothetical protein